MGTPGELEALLYPVTPPLALQDQEGTSFPQEVQPS